jgi:phosphoribosylformylglycinamidine synthase
MLLKGLTILIYIIMLQLFCKAGKRWIDEKRPSGGRKMKRVRRIYVEKKPDFDQAARNLYLELHDHVGIRSLESLRLLHRYDLAGITEEEYAKVRQVLFAENLAHRVYEEVLPLAAVDTVLAMEYLPGQHDQKLEATLQCLRLITGRETPVVRTARVLILRGVLSASALDQIKSYCLNPVESREADQGKPETLERAEQEASPVEIIRDFAGQDAEELQKLQERLALAMSLEDLRFCQSYFRNEEKRDPTITEMKVIDTYWSDHCRHKTFFTPLAQVAIEEGDFSQAIQSAYQRYLADRTFVYGDEGPDVCLMDLAVLGMKKMRKQGLLPDVEISDEVNACSISANVNVDGRQEEWLVMFKNETHNHPTEIEPFGGAATCLGGAIRDPLSGRAYVYQAMRVTGSADPRAKIEDTLPEKLPQRKITKEAAAGYSSYGNQVGVPAGQVVEYYHEGFLAKRMELGAVIGAVPRKNVRRLAPEPGDLVLLVGAKTGRDGCGGAAGSSREYTGETEQPGGVEVPKGNPTEERKLLRLFRNPAASRLIKKCNDFGAGGVSVAIGELADGLEIDLDAVPTKYAGLDGTELAISESQERMAVVVAREDADRMIRLAREENLEATVVARVTGDRRMKMYWRGRPIVDLKRDFLNTGGIKKASSVVVVSPRKEENYFTRLHGGLLQALPDLRRAWLFNLQRLDIGSQRGMVEQFDSTAGGNTVLLPLGGRYQLTPQEGMVAKIPVQEGETSTVTMMTHGYNPRLASWSPFHGALYAVVEAVSKIVALGGDYTKVRLTLQEYFERLEDDPVKWGKPFSALLGAYLAQESLQIPAIGGKDSMSGSFKDRHVPPTLVAFAVTVTEVDKVVSREFKRAGSRVVLLPLPRDEQELPDFAAMKRIFQQVQELIAQGGVLASSTVKEGGLAAAISQMCFGNNIGMIFQENHELELDRLFAPDYGSLILEIKNGVDLEEAFRGVAYRLLGRTREKSSIEINGIEIPLAEAVEAWESTLDKVFPLTTNSFQEKAREKVYTGRGKHPGPVRLAKPRVLLPVFPGTNGEYETAEMFRQAGGVVRSLVFRDLTIAEIKSSLADLSKSILDSQILVLPGGFSAGDEPEGAGKFIELVFRHPQVAEALMEFLDEKRGLILGIGNGFQALVRLGLLPYGEIRTMGAGSPLLTENRIGRPVSRL